MHDLPICIHSKNKSIPPTQKKYVVDLYTISIFSILSNYYLCTLCCWTLSPCCCCVVVILLLLLLVLDAISSSPLASTTATIIKTNNNIEYNNIIMSFSLPPTYSDNHFSKQKTIPRSISNMHAALNYRSTLKTKSLRQFHPTHTLNYNKFTYERAMLVIEFFESSPSL